MSDKSKIKYKPKIKLGKKDQLDVVCDNCGSDIDGANINN